MKSWFVLLISAIVLLILLVGLMVLTLWDSKRKFERIHDEFELKTDIVNTYSVVRTHAESINNYPFIKEYVFGVYVLFEKYLMCIEQIKIGRMTLVDKRRLLLLKDYEKAPDSIKDIMLKYSMLLEGIYRYNHPFKYFWGNCRQFITSVLVHILIFIISVICIIIGIFEVLLKNVLDVNDTHIWNLKKALQLFTSTKVACRKGIFS